MPKIIFWNLRGDTRDFPLKSDTNNTILLSGFSPTLLNSILKGDEITPYLIIRKIIDSERYNIIKAPK